MAGGEGCGSVNAAVAKFLFILMAQGSGANLSTPLPVAMYPSMPSCQAALEYVEQHDQSWTQWFCAPVPLPEGAIPLIGKVN